MAHILSKRAYLYIIIFFIAVFIMSLFASCGSDTVVNGNGNNNETFLYNIDSLKAYMPNGQFTNDTVLSITNANQVRVTFNCTSNTDSINTWALFKITGEYIDTNNVLHTYIDSLYNNISGLNNNFSFYINSATDYSLTLYIQIQRNPPAECFIKLSNIQVLRVN